DDTWVGLGFNRHFHVAVIAVKTNFLVGELLLDAIQNLIKKPNIAVGHGNFTGDSIPITAIKGAAVLALAEITAMAGTNANPRRCRIFTEEFSSRLHHNPEYFGIGNIQL